MEDKCTNDGRLTKTSNVTEMERKRGVGEEEKAEGSPGDEVEEMWKNKKEERNEAVVEGWRLGTDLRWRPIWPRGEPAAGSRSRSPSS